MAVAKSCFFPSAPCTALTLFAVRSVVCSQQTGKLLNKIGYLRGKGLMHVYCAVKDFLLLVSNYSPYYTSPLCLFPPSVFFLSLMSGKTMKKRINSSVSHCSNCLFFFQHNKLIYQMPHICPVLRFPDTIE